MANPIRVAVVGPHPLFVEGVVQTIKRDKQLEILAGVANLQAMERAIEEKQLDVMLIDNATPGIEAGLEPETCQGQQEARSVIGVEVE